MIGTVRRNPYAPWWRLVVCGLSGWHAWQTVSRRLQRPDESESWQWCSRCWARGV